MTRDRRHIALLTAVLAGALALRAWRLAADLPDFVEEAIPFRRALEMGGWQAGAPDLHPRFFNYPSLVIYLQLALIRLQMLAGLATGQLAAAADFWLRCQTDPTGPVLAARAVSIAADLACILGVWRLARRHGPAAALLACVVVAVAGPMVRTARLIQVDPVQAALTVWALERMLAWRTDGGRRRLIWAVVLVGLAAGAKYHGGLLVLPLAWVLWSRDGRAGLWRWPLLAVGSLAVFLLTTPYALLDAPAFWHDLTFEAGHMRSGHLGSAAGGSLTFVARSLWQGLGPVALLAAVAGLTAPLWQRRRPDDDEMVLWLAVLPLLVAVTTAAVQAERYLVPLVPLLALAAARGLEALLDVPGVRGRAWPAWVLATAMVVPSLLALRPTLPTAAHHDQVLARRWLEAHADRGEVMLSERYTAAVRNEADDVAMRAHPAWQRASAQARRAYDALPRLRNIVLPLVVSGHADIDAVGLAGRPVRLPFVPHITDLNAVFYDPALLHDVTWVQVSGSLRSRHEADPTRYPAQVAWYRHLDRHGARVARFAGTVGTAVTIYRLDHRGTTPPPLDPLWWTAALGDAFPRAFEACCVPPDQRTGGARFHTSGRPAAWVQALRGYFTSQVAPFLVRLGLEHQQTDHLAAARQVLMPVMLMAPHHDAALEQTVTVCRRQDDPWTAEAMLDRSLHVRRQLGRSAALVHLLRAGLRLDEGRLDEARALADAARRDPGADAAVRERAADFLAHLDEGTTP